MRAPSFPTRRSSGLPLAGGAIGIEGDGEIVAVLVGARERVAVARDLDALLREFGRHPVGRPGGRGGSCEAEVHRRLVGAARVVRVYVDLDRKSTRLNSSH